jgi:exodeoxyribonuclease VII large subunit
MFEAQRTRLDRGRDGVRGAPGVRMVRRGAALDRTAARLQALSPKATLARGYAIVRTGDGVLRDAALATPGARIDVELARGGLGARVEDVRAR